MKYLYLPGLFFVFSHLAVAQANKWTLKSCVDKAVQNNLQLTQSLYSIKTNRNNLEQSYADLAPTLNGTVGQSFNAGRNIDPYTNTYVNQSITSSNFSVTSNVTLFNGFRQINTIRQSHSNVEASRMDYENSRNELMLNVVNAFIQVLFNKELLRTAQKQAGYSVTVEKRTAQLTDAGAATQAALAEARSKLASDRLSVVTAENQLSIALLNLQQYMNLPYSPDFDIEIPVLTIPTFDSTETPHELYMFAESWQPVIKAAKFRTTASQIGVQLAKGAVAPTLTLGGTLSTLYSSSNKDVTVVAPGVYNVTTTPFNNQLKNNQRQTLGFSLSIPFVNNRTVSVNIRNAVNTFKTQELSLGITRNQLRQTIETAYNNARTASKKNEYAELQKQATESSYLINRAKFELGAANVAEYSLSLTNYERAISEALQARYDLILKVKILEFYRGGDLSEW